MYGSSREKRTKQRNVRYETREKKQPLSRGTEFEKIHSSRDLRQGTMLGSKPRGHEKRKGRLNASDSNGVRDVRNSQQRAWHPCKLSSAQHYRVRDANPPTPDVDVLKPLSVCSVAARLFRGATTEECSQTSEQS